MCGTLEESSFRAYAPPPGPSAQPRGGNQAAAEERRPASCDRWYASIPSRAHQFGLGSDSCAQSDRLAAVLIPSSPGAQIASRPGWRMRFALDPGNFRLSLDQALRTSATGRCGYQLEALRRVMRSEVGAQGVCVTSTLRGNPCGVLNGRYRGWPGAIRRIRSAFRGTTYDGATARQRVRLNRLKRLSI